MPRKTFTFDGKRYDMTAPTEEELHTKIALKKRDLEQGRVVVSQNMLVKDWTDQWLETYKVNAITDVTYTGYKSRIHKHITPVVGGMKIKDVRPIHLQRIMNNLNGYSKDFISKVEYTLDQIFQAAVQNRLILDNPAESLTKPKAKNGTHRAMTKAERDCLLKVAETHKHGLWLKTMYYCGLRPGETRLIQGRHIRNGNLTIPGTKSKAAERVVPIPKVLLDDFEKLKLEPFEYVFKNKAGKQLTLSNFRSMWKNVKREMNIAMGCKVYRNQVLKPHWVADDLVPYCLRHTYCTELQDAGVPINVAKELMGHTDISVTARIYTHQSEKSFNDARDKIDAYINKQQEKDAKTPTPTPTLVKSS